MLGHRVQRRLLRRSLLLLSGDARHKLAVLFGAGCERVFSLAEGLVVGEITVVRVVVVGDGALAFGGVFSAAALGVGFLRRGLERCMLAVVGTSLASWV